MPILGTTEERRKESKRKWREKNGTEYARKYRAEHKDEINRNQRKYYNMHKKEIYERNKKWEEENKEKCLQSRRIWHKNNVHKVKVWRRQSKERNREAYNMRRNRSTAKRKRELGYKPINKKEIGMDGHHIDKDLVIFIPEKLHKLIPHAQKNLKSMKAINILAIQVAYI